MLPQHVRARYLVTHSWMVHFRSCVTGAPETGVHLVSGRRTPRHFAQRVCSGVSEMVRNEVHSVFTAVACRRPASRHTQIPIQMASAREMGSLNSRIPDPAVSYPRKYLSHLSRFCAGCLFSARADVQTRRRSSDDVCTGGNAISCRRHTIGMSRRENRRDIIPSRLSRGAWVTDSRGLSDLVS